MLRDQTHLRKLFLDDNQISHVAVASFDGLSSLEWLNLGSNRLATFDLGELFDMPTLQMLNLSHNHLLLENVQFPVMPAIREMWVSFAKKLHIREEL